MRARVSPAVHPKVFLPRMPFLPQPSLLPVLGRGSEYVGMHTLRLGCEDLPFHAFHFLTGLPPTKEEVNVLPVFVCLSVCLLARLLKNACMDLDEMLRVDRCQDMDELVNF